MPHMQSRIGVISDFNASNLCRLLERDPKAGVICDEAPYAQTSQLLLDGAAPFWSESRNAVVVWTLPSLVSLEFARVAAGLEASAPDLQREVEWFAAQLGQLPAAGGTIIVPTWTAPELGRGLGPLDFSTHAGIASTLARMNLWLADSLQGDRRVFVVDAQKWIMAAGPCAYNARLWYRSKTPFDNAVFGEAASDILSLLQGLQGRTRKVAILDLDNTLWGGIVGDDGWEQLRLGGHDPIGEAFADFQRGLKRLVNRGVLLAVVSKNEDAIAMEAIARHPEMILASEDFAALRINWRDKAENIVELMREMNLGLDSAVFFDDSPFERARVREALPEVLVPDLPGDPMLCPAFLASLSCFDSPSISAEDRVRSLLYAADRERAALRSSRSIDEWLKELDLRVTPEVLSEANIERAAQLMNKTNQMNLSTRRVTSSELITWSQSDAHRVWTFRVTDRFGDYGLCGLASVMTEGGRARLLDFVLSCRVLGRGVEDVMLRTSADFAAGRGCDDLYAVYLQTSRNQPCLAWLRGRLDLIAEGDRFVLQLKPPIPTHV